MRPTAIMRRSYEPLERRRELLETMLRFELLAQRARAEGLNEHLSVQLAYAAALSAAIQAQAKHEELTQEAESRSQQSRAAEELEELQRLHDETRRTADAEASRVRTELQERLAELEPLPEQLEASRVELGLVRDELAALLESATAEKEAAAEA